MQKVKRRAEVRAGVRDIGKIPSPVNHKRRKRCAQDLLAFLRGYLPARFPLAFSHDHLQAIDGIQGIILFGGLRALAMPRGSGKTTILEGACVWALLYGHRKFLCVVAATGAAALAILENIKSELEHNDALLADFPDACYPIRKLGGVAQRAEAQTANGLPTHVVWTSSEVRLPAMAAGGGAVIQTSGLTGAIRGAKASRADGTSVRPDLVLIDDFQTRKSAKSSAQTTSRLQIMQSDILGLAGPGQTIAAFCACTIIHRGDGAAQILDRRMHPEWQGTTARLMRSMPSKSALVKWDEYTEIYKEDLANPAIAPESKLIRSTAFYRDNRAAMDDGADPAWPERKSPGELTATQHAMNLLITRGQEAFYAEYQNQPLGLEAADALVQLEPEAVAKRLNRKKPGVVPVGAQELVAFIDVGEGVLWYQVAAFQQGFRGDCVAYGAWPEPGRAYFTKAESKDLLRSRYPLGSIQATWTAALTELCEMLMGRDWQGEDGESHRISLALIDAGDGDATDTIFEFIAQSPFRDRLHPSRGKGIGATNRPMGDWPKNKGDTLGNGWRIQRNKVRRQKEVVIDVNRWKSFVADRLTAPAGGPSCYYLHGDHSGAHELMSHHLCSERRIRVTAVGRSVDEWRIKPGQDNDLLDTTVGVHVAASIRGIRLADLPSQENRGGVPVSFAEQQRAARERRRA